ncbi:unnamed protein product [Rotaria socialis]|uniref:CRESS-DNA virus Rep endonuclease domain-containing protein n=1 Tax=Rotaria socialis TaxID=392032 RepID=A0A817UBK7_9BILA|nr:unnamed protein product [Rotaria socialis]CAF4588870.1 unnamed protein product [Rotaria socialis]
MNAVKADRYAFTSWQEPRKTDGRIKFMCWGKEATQQGKEHYQGYIELDKAYTLPWVKRIIGIVNNIHLEEAREDRYRNISYCLKSKPEVSLILDRKRRVEDEPLDWADEFENENLTHLFNFS